MRKIYEYFISILLIIFSTFSSSHAQDTVLIPLKIKVGVDLLGPVNYYLNKDILSAEGYIAADLNEKLTITLNAGYLDYKNSEYNFEYNTKGSYLRAGVDLNLIKPKKSQGKYWVGAGLRYGLSVYNSEVPFFSKENYWGKTYSSVGTKSGMAHFFELSPGVRAEVLKNFTIGWSVSLRKLISSGANDVKPIYIPGYGNTGKTLSTGMNYFIVWNIPFKKISVIIKKETKETEEEGESDNPQNNTEDSSGSWGSDQNFQRSSSGNKSMY